MIKCLHFSGNELNEFIDFCWRHPDIEYVIHEIRDQTRPYSVHMTYTKESTNDEIYEKLIEIRNGCYLKK